MAIRIKAVLRMLRLEMFTATIFVLLAVLSLNATTDQGLVHLVIAWPAAGFAMAAVYFWGNRILPAIALGAAITYFGFAHRPLSDAVILAGLAAIQAAMGAALSRVAEEKIKISVNLREAFARLVVPFTVGSFLLPFGEVFLSPGIRVGPTELGYLYVYRWAAEAIGCMAAFPITLLMLENRPRPRAGKLITVGLFAIVLSGLLAFFQAWNRSEANSIGESFTRRTLTIEQSIRKHMNLSFESVRTIGQFFDVSGSVSRREFSNFVVPFFSRHPGVRAYEWIERVENRNRSEFESRMRLEGHRDFEIRRGIQTGVVGRQVTLDEYFPIAFLEPLVGNELAIGYDVKGTPGAELNLGIARDTGRVSLSDPLTLIQEKGGQRGIVAYYPVYRGGKVPNTVERRREELRGLVGGVFRMGDLVENALDGLDLRGIEIRLSALAGNENISLYSSPIPSDEVRTTYHRSTPFEIENQKWNLSTTLTQQMLHANRRPAFWMLPIGGALGCGIALFMILLLTGRSAEIESLIVERTSELRRALRVRDDFLLAASHELKTPLTPLRLQVEFLAELVARGKIEEFARGPDFAPMLEGIGREVERYSRLVGDLLDFSRLSAGNFRLDRRECDLGEVAKEVKDMFALEFERAGCAIHFSVTGRPIGNWDRLRLKQILVNLLSNAIKYGAGNPIEILVEGDARKSRLTVVDHGIGIGKADHERIFERFVRVVPVQNYGGLGIGLFVVRELVTAHGGTVSVSSEPGQGSTFTVELPNFA